MGCTFSSEHEATNITPIFRVLEGWTDHEFAIHLRSPNIDRFILISKLRILSRPSSWDGNYDLWLIPTHQAAEGYSKIRELLASEPQHVINFATGQETGFAKAQGVGRWWSVASLLAMPLPWHGYRYPFGEFQYRIEQDVGCLYKGVFNKENVASARSMAMMPSVDLSNCVIAVWHRYQYSQHVDYLVAAANGEPFRATLGGSGW